MANPGSKGAVAAAIAGNASVMLAKFVAFLFTGSGTMLSEAIHTLADLLNQILLMVGIVHSSRKADDYFQYGYQAARYVWALISAVGIFFLGCGVTIYHGIQTLLHPHALTDLGWALGVLLFSLVLEGAVLLIALRTAKHQAGQRPLLIFLRDQADPAVVAVVLEDSAACLGIVLAMIAIILARLTGETYWDAVGSITIGLLLGAVAIWLIRRNAELLMGSSIPESVRQQVLQIIERDPAVEEVVDIKTRILDTETYRIKADIRFEGDVLTEKLRPQLRSAYDQINNYEDFEKFAREFGDDVVELLAEKIDTIEQRIRSQIPQAKHMDLEAE
jgi:solute carrier family 30 (zinc transporter), member 9